MVKFIDVDPNEIDNTRNSHRGRVSYPILKMFLESNKYLVQLDRTGMQQSFQALYSSLNSYIRNHNLPIKLISRGREIYLCRLDIDKDGTPIPDWQQRLIDAEYQGEVMPINSEEVAKRFDEEKDKTTK